MSELSEHLTFEEWVRYCFDRPIGEPAWFWDERENDWYVTSSATVIDYLTQLFENSGTLLANYSRAQIAQGLKYLANYMCSDNMISLLYEEIPIAARKRAVASIGVLFEQLFNKQCQGVGAGIPAQAKSKNDDPLDNTCYMWWDTFIIGSPDDSPLYFDFIEVMKRTLALESEACRESALHGLGHAEYKSPDIVHRIIDDFIERGENISPQLRKYAARAREGSVQ